MVFINNIGISCIYLDCKNGNLYTHYSETCLLHSAFCLRLINIHTHSYNSFIFLVEYSRVCMSTYPFSWWKTFVLFPFFSLLQIGPLWTLLASMQVSQGVCLEVILASSTLLDAANWPGKVLYSYQYCLQGSVAPHFPPNLAIVVLLEVLAIW